MNKGKKTILARSWTTMDCDTKDLGCNGSQMTSAFTFILDHHGLASEKAYPSVGADDQCQTTKVNNGSTITGYESVPANDEAALLQAVVHQPVSVPIDASSDDFKFYESGVFSGECGTPLDHGVIAVGFGVDDDGTKFWIVKNSWGAGWGEDGYIRMKRDVDQAEGLCGIAMDASYPIIGKRSLI